MMLLLTRSKIKIESEPEFQPSEEEGQDIQLVLTVNCKADEAQRLIGWLGIGKTIEANIRIEPL